MEIKIRDVVAFRTEDAKFPAANLLRGGKWISEKKSRSSANDITLHLGEAHLISHIDVGNWGSSFINIEVSRVGLQRYQTLLPSTELMNARDAQTKKNWTAVHMFSKEHFVEDVLEQKWNLVRVTCLQPFLQNEQFGLSFFKVFSIAEDKLPVQQPEPQPPSGSVFAMMRDCSLAKVSPLVVNRSQQLVLAAIEKQKPTLKCSSETKRKEAMAASSSNNGESLPVTVDLPSKENNFKAKVSNGTTPRSLNNKNFSQNCVSTLQARAQTSKKFSSPSLAGCKKSTDCHLAQPRHGSCSIAKIQNHPSPCDVTGKTVETVRNMKRRLTFLSPAGSENDHTSVAKVACMKRRESIGKQQKLVHAQVHSSCGGQKKHPEIYDLTDSDSDAPTVQLPLATSLNREMRDIDNDTDIIILPSDETQDEIHIEEFVPLDISSSPKRSSSDVLPWDSDAVAGPSRITCPLCSNFFDAASIEQHAATCGLTSNIEDSICPICSGYFPPDVLPRHADLCAERTLA